MDGILILDKPTGLTSQQALSRVRRALKIKKAGHTGTLDPLATGVLPLALGEATKIIPYLEESTKVYRVTGRLGETTDSYDSDGRILLRSDPSGIGNEAIEAALQAFLGPQDQLPPAYSAIKLQGRPLYDYARSGEEVELKPRRVHFEVLDLETVTPPDFTIRIVCSKGTYVRSLIHDLGQKLGCGAHVIQLRRLASGCFDLERSLGLDQVLEDPQAALIQLLSIEELLKDWPQIELLDLQEKERARSGVSLRRINQLIENNKLFSKPMVLVRDTVIQALIEAQPGRDFEYLRVLNRQESV